MKDNIDEYRTRVMYNMCDHTGTIRSDINDHLKTRSKKKQYRKLC